MKVAFFTICVNSEPLIEAWIKHYQAVLDQLIIVEGATDSFAKALNWRSPRSTDNTIEIIKKYPNVQLIQLPFNYKDKNEMCNEAMRIINKDIDYVWYADSDEFYKHDDIYFIKQLLGKNEYSYVEFKMHHFWKHFDVIGVGGNKWAYDTSIPRIWKYHNGASFINHRPPTILNGQNIDLKNIKPLFAENNPVKCLHYSYIFEQQVREKMQYYSIVFERDYMGWFNNCWKAWSKLNRQYIESRYSIHPSNAGATTQDIQIEHPKAINEIIPKV